MSRKKTLFSNNSMFFMCVCKKNGDFFEFKLKTQNSKLEPGTTFSPTYTETSHGKQLHDKKWVVQDKRDHIARRLLLQSG